MSGWLKDPLMHAIDSCLHAMEWPCAIRYKLDRNSRENSHEGVRHVLGESKFPATSNVTQ